MTAMHPDSGVPWQDARNSIPSEIEQSQHCDELWYSTSRCQPRFDPAAANAVLAELINLINKGEVSYDCSFLDQVQLSVRYLIQRGLPRAGVLLGGPSTYVLALDPPLTRYNDYLTLTVISSVANNGPVTVSVDGHETVPLLRNDHRPLKQGDLYPGEPLEIIYWHSAFHVVGLVRSQATFPQERRFEYPGSYSWEVPAGVTDLQVEIYGGGGAGGTGHANFVGGAGGGGAGSARKNLTYPPGSVLSFVVGAGGLAGGVGTITAGQPGGTTSFMSGLFYATGGGGGEAGIYPIPGTPASSIPGRGYGGDVNYQGAYGSSGASGTNDNGGYTGYGGLGGAVNGPEGGKGGAMSTGSSGSGIGYGAGGSGGGSASGINARGGDGYNGCVIIRWIG